MNVFIIIPAYNEQTRIQNVITGLKQAGYPRIVVVDDGSAESLGALVRPLGVDFIRHPINLGQGAALQTGMDYAKSAGADAVVHFDADGQHRVEDIATALQVLEEGYDIVFGSRLLSTKQHMPWTKKWLILKPGILVNWIFTGLRLSDAHPGFRVLNRKALEKIRITQNRMAHATEVVSEVVRHQLRYTEVPIEVMYYEYGQSWGGGVKIIVDLLKKVLFG
jgi:glycosyltransferase involved in cell wall biosynthesis